MRKLIFILGFTLTITFGYGQSSKTQTPTSTKSTATETETLEWLIEKFKAYNVKTYKHVFNDCSITEYNNVYGILSSGTIYLYDIKKIYEDEGFIAIETIHKSIVRWVAFQNQETEKCQYVSRESKFTTSINAFGEADLINRMNDALLHLKDFCNKKGKKDGEKF